MSNGFIRSADDARFGGGSVCRRVKSVENRPYVYVIMLTAKTRESDIVQALDSGADDYVTKPFDALELKSRVKARVRVLDLEERLQTKIDELQIALDHVERLQEMLPMCAWCKRVREITTIGSV